MVCRPQNIFLSLTIKIKVRHHDLPHFFRTVRKCGAAQCGCGWTLKIFFCLELSNSSRNGIKKFCLPISCRTVRPHLAAPECAVTPYFCFLGFELSKMHFKAILKAILYLSNSGALPKSSGQNSYCAAILK